MTHRPPRAASRTPRLVVFAALGVIALLGGGSRIDIATLPLVELFALVVLGAFLWRPAPLGRAFHPALWLLLGLSGIMVLQLLPLPPAIWQLLPGRERLTALVIGGGVNSVWRPMSIQPAATLASLLSMVVPLSLVVWIAQINPRDWWQVFAAILVIGLVEAFTALLQISSGNDQLYFYRYTNVGAPVGLFSNRNHFALFMAIMPTALAVVMLRLRHRGVPAPYRLGAAGLVLLMNALPLLVGGSRIGLIALAASTLIALWLYFGFKAPLAKATQAQRIKGWQRYTTGIVAGLLILFTGAVVALGRFSAVDRLLSTSTASEGRVRNFGMILALIRSYLPIGAGFGTFDRAYRMIEAPQNLMLSYLNHAHNDVAEIVFEGGLPSAGLVLALALMFVRRAATEWLTPRISFTSERAAVRGAMGVVVILALGSTTDYPLRTPFLGAIGAITFAMALYRPAAIPGPPAQ